MSNGTFINADICLLRHIGNVLLADHYFVLVRQGQRWETLLKFPEQWYRACTIVLEFLEGGKYKGADLWRVFQHHNYSGWFMTICHPNCPVVEEGMEIPSIDCNVTMSERQQIQEAMFGYFHVLNTEENLYVVER